MRVSCPVTGAIFGGHVLALGVFRVASEAVMFCERRGIL